MDVPLEELQRERLEADIRLRILETEATLRQEIIRQYTFYNPRLYTNFDVILSTKDDKPVACIVQVENDCPSSWRCVREAYSNGTEFHLEALETLLSLVRGEGGQPQYQMFHGRVSEIKHQKIQAVQEEAAAKESKKQKKQRKREQPKWWKKLLK